MNLEGFAGRHEGGLQNLKAGGGISASCKALYLCAGGGRFPRPGELENCSNPLTFDPEAPGWSNQG